MAAAVAVWWKGGTLGDPANINDGTKRVTVENMVTFNSNIDVEGVQFACTNAYVSALCQAHDVQALADVTALRDVAASRDLSVGRNLSVTGLTTLTGGGSITAAMHCSGNGRYINRGATGPTAGTASISLNDASRWYFSGSSGNQTITVTGAQEGDTIDLFNGGTHTITLAGTGTSNIAAPIYPFLGTSNQPFSIRAMFVSGAWYPLNLGMNP
jgi:hypothetical protein